MALQTIDTVNIPATSERIINITESYRQQYFITYPNGTRNLVEYNLTSPGLGRPIIFQKLALYNARINHYMLNYLIVEIPIPNDIATITKIVFESDAGGYNYDFAVCSIKEFSASPGDNSSVVLSAIDSIGLETELIDSVSIVDRKLNIELNNDAFPLFIANLTGYVTLIMFMNDTRVTGEEGSTYNSDISASGIVNLKITA